MTFNVHILKINSLYDQFHGLQHYLNDHCTIWMCFEMIERQKVNKEIASVEASINDSVTNILLHD